MLGIVNSTGHCHQMIVFINTSTRDLAWFTITALDLFSESVALDFSLFIVTGNNRFSLNLGAGSKTWATEFPNNQYMTPPICVNLLQ
jgi:hypothetical protein